ncbi:hypothetical protein [Saccharothrix sp. NRRL B-16314]|uniref:hypothetical protein n=1 Tax=Saccharothrix sp. NRRL B-16314 TaxID=1463825 RepID=UPI000524DD96|nr:hypothetical protein [Saccharothrix sp. NRRL B-16314]
MTDSVRNVVVGRVVESTLGLTTCLDHRGLTRSPSRRNSGRASRKHVIAVSVAPEVAERVAEPDEQLPLARPVVGPPGFGVALNRLGELFRRTDRFEWAMRCHRWALDLFAAADVPKTLFSALFTMVVIHRQLWDFEASRILGVLPGVIGPRITDWVAEV